MKSTPQNSQHFTSGSTYTPLQPGVLRIYSMFFCPYAIRTTLILNLKKIDYETVNINLNDKPEWFLKTNPMGKVPTLQKDDKIMYESMIICDFLNEAKPEPPLYPSDPWAKAVDKGLIELFGNKVVSEVTKVMRHFSDKELVRSVPEKVKSGLDFFEEELTGRKTIFFFGKRPGMLDYAIFPWFQIIRVFEYQIKDFEILSKDRFPKLTDFETAMSEDHIVKSTVPKFSDYVEFFKSLWNGNPNYNVGCD